MLSVILCAMEGIGLVLSLLLAGSLQAFPLSSQANCGQRNSGGNLYIAGGLRAIEGEFPWQVSIQVRTKLVDN